MHKPQAPSEDYDAPTYYEIRIKGHLDDRWVDWFESMTIKLEDNGDALLTGLVIDQAALQGLLKKVRDLGMPLLSVRQMGQTSNSKGRRE